MKSITRLMLVMVLFNGLSVQIIAESTDSINANLDDTQYSYQNLELAKAQKQYDTLVQESKKIDSKLKATNSEIIDKRENINTIQEEIPKVEDQAEAGLIILQRNMHVNYLINILAHINDEDFMSQLRIGQAATHLTMASMNNIDDLVAMQTEVEADMSKLIALSSNLEKQQALAQSNSMKLAALIESQENEVIDEETEFASREAQEKFFKSEGCGEGDIYGIDCGTDLPEVIFNNSSTLLAYASDGVASSNELDETNEYSNKNTSGSNDDEKVINVTSDDTKNTTDSGKDTSTDGGTDTSTGDGTDTSTGGGKDTSTGGGKDTSTGGGKDTSTGGGTDTSTGGGTDTSTGGGTDTSTGGGKDTSTGGGTDTSTGGGTDTSTGGGKDTSTGGGTDTSTGGGKDTSTGGGTDTSTGGGTDTSTGGGTDTSTGGGTDTSTGGGSGGGIGGGRDSINEESNEAVSTGFSRPMQSGVVTKEYNGVNLHGTVHRGIDIANDYGTPVYPVADGVVIETGSDKTRGNYVTLVHNVNGTNYTTTYWHMSNVTVAQGQYVTSDYQIGAVGKSGIAGGANLHLGINANSTTFSNQKAVDPRLYISFPEKNVWFYTR